MAVHQTITNNYQNSRYIVGTGAFATIQAAINEANANGGNAVVFLRPGTYTENLTLYSTVSLEGAENSLCTITGKHTPPATGTINFTRITLASSTHILDSNAAGTTAITFNRCIFNCTNGYTCNLPNWTGAITIKFCSDLSASNGVINNAGGSNVVIRNSLVGTGAAALTTNGNLDIFNGKIGCPVTLAGSNASSIIEAGSVINGTLTTGGSATLVVSNSRIASATATAITVGSSSPLYLSNVVLNTTNATAIGGTGSVQFNEVTFTNSSVLAGTITEVLTGSVKTGEIYANTILRMDMSGFYSWAAAAPYSDIATLGTFKLLVGGMGYIRGKVITWVAQNITGMTSGATWFIYIDATGTIGKSSTRTDALFIDNIVLFECLYDETTGTKQQHVVRENHTYNYPVAVSNYEHDVIGVVIENANNGANIIAGSTDVRVSISGDDVLADHGLATTITTATDVSWKKFYKNAAGKWAVDATGTDFAGRYNNAGTPTALTAGRFGVYRLYVGKDSGNAATPVYYAVLNAAQYTNAGNAATAISNGTVSVVDGELALLELAQLGYITFSQATGAITVFTIAKSTLKSTISAGPGAAVAVGVSTNTASFDGMLSGTDTNVQAALDTIDNWGAGTTDKCLMVGNGVGVAPGVLAVGGTGTILTGVAANDPTWTTATYPATIAIGEVLHGSASNVISGLAAGTTGKVLRAVTSAAPAWTTSTFADTYAIGGILHASAANVVTALATGATGTILRGATGAAPAWTTATYPATVATGDIIAATNTNVITVIAGTTATANYVLTGNGSGVLPSWKAAAAGGGLTWAVQATDLDPMVVDHGYIANKVGLLTFTLPATCAVGKVFRVTGMNTAVGWRIAQLANQIIHFGTSTTATGAGGYLESTAIHDSVELVCCVADLEFIMVSSTGNITIA